MPTLLKKLLSEAVADPESVTFFKPELGSGTLRNPDPAKEPELFPHRDLEPTSFIVFKEPLCVIPFHSYPEHDGRRQRFIHGGNGVIWIWRENIRTGFDKFILTSDGDEVSAEPGYRIALGCFAVKDRSRPCELLVQSSLKMPCDNRITWGSASRGLLSNKHKAPVVA
jgi:hypothetical protein